LTVHTALRLRGQRSGPVPSGRNGYRYSCSAADLWHPYRTTGRPDWAKARHLPAHAAVVCLQSAACVFDGSDHACLVRGSPGVLYHLVRRNKRDDHGVGATRAARQVEWTAGPLYRAGDDPGGDHWRAHLEGTRAYICLCPSHRAGSAYASASVVYGTGDASTTEPWRDEGELNMTKVPTATVAGRRCSGRDDRSGCTFKEEAYGTRSF
jgi:hypothetical protein